MNRGHKVKPQSCKSIRALACYVRDEFGIMEKKFPIVYFVEQLAEREAIDFQIATEAEMPDKFGLTYPKRNIIRLREDAYDDAVNGGGFGRFTLAHEFGHLLLHRDELVYARTDRLKPHKVYEDSEWQADKFAQELLVDASSVIDAVTPEAIALEYGVTPKASEVAHKALVKEGIIKIKASRNSMRL